VVAFAFSAGPLVGTAAADPINLLQPMISPTSADVGTTLTVTQGTWFGASAITDEWIRCDASSNCVSTGVTGSSYTVTPADGGDTLKVSETAQASDGSTSNRDSNSTDPIPPSNTVAPQINSSPPPYDGNTLTVTPGTWPGADSITDTWLNCDASGQNCQSTGVTGTSYTLSDHDLGNTIVVQETASAGSTQATSPVLSQPTAVVTLPVPTDTSVPTISGSAVQGQTLTASPGDWERGPTSFDYRWQDCDSGGKGCSAIAGATAATYTLTAGDVGHTIVVSVSGVNGSGPGPAAASVATGLVHATSTVSLATSPAAPVVNQAVTLAATVAASGSTPTGTVQFTNQGTPISGCTAQPASPTGHSATASCQTAFPIGSAKLAATFTPSVGSAVLGSASAGQTLAVGQDTTTTGLDVSSQVNVQASTTYTATVVPAHSGPIAPSGPVQFLSDGRPIAGCTAQPLLGGGATCTVKYATTGQHAISAHYLGDANFAGSSSTAKPVRVIALPAKGAITATMQWTFHYTPSYTRVIAMVINGVPKGATVQIQCHGRGCPFSQRRSTIGKPKPCRAKQKRTCPASGRLDLSSAFHRRNLRNGARITIIIRRPRYIGKYYRFTMRARRQPLVRIDCLALNSTRPGVGCTAPK
jgi:hypothetical protein